MRQLLLLANAEGVASVSELAIRELREYPGEDGVSVHFRPVRNDALFHSAKVGSEIAYRILAGEGVVRSQLWVEYEVRGPQVNVTGRSGDLLFALALLTSRWNGPGAEYPAIAATGVLSSNEARVGVDPAPAVTGVAHVEAKIAAAVRALAGERAGVIFYPAAERARVEAWCAAAAVPPNIRIASVTTLEDALSVLGVKLEKVYLGNPYRGLEYFDYAHRSVFFGRDGEIRELAALLLRREAAGAPGVLVEGASGSGKSSFLRAGILPALLSPRARAPQLESAFADRPVTEAASGAIWHPALATSAAGEGALATSIHRVWKVFPELAGDSLPDRATLEDLLLLWRARWPRDRRFIWIVDQLEELFHLGLGESPIEAFGGFLRALQREGAWSLASIRADALPNLKRYNTLREVFGSNEGQYYLASLGATALDDVIYRPAKAAGLTFGVTSGGKRLDQTLREDAYRDHENALPLLQLTLHELYRRRAGRELSHAVYDELGGLSGAVATIAAAALKRASYDKAGLSRLFRNLVSVDGSGMVMRRHAPRSEVAENPAQEQLLDALVNARLCVSDQQEDQPVVVLAHEAVLRTWPDLVDWLQEEWRLLQLRELAEHDARLWQQHACSDSWLAPPGKLAALEVLRAADVRLSRPLSQFVERSRKRARRAARLRKVGLGALILLALAASVSGVIAVSRQRDAQFEAARAVQAKNEAMIEAETARSTAGFLEMIFDAPTPEHSLGRPIAARELLDAGARRLEAGLIAAPETRARLTEEIGNAYRELGEYGRAALLLESAITQYGALPDSPTADRAEAYTALGQLYQARDERASAEKALRQAMALESEIPAVRRSAMPNLVFAQVETGAADFPASRQALDRASEIIRNRGRVSDRESYLLLLRYSQLDLRQGRLREARRLGLDALAAQARVLGPDDPSAITVAEYMEDLCQRTNDAVAGERYGRRALALAKQIYGENHPIYAQVLGQYAINFGILGERGVVGANEKAEALFRKVLAIRMQTLGPHSVATGDAYYDIANASAARGRWAEALPLIRHAHRIWESAQGSDSPQVAWALTMEARALTHLGRPAEAVPLALRSLRISERKQIEPYAGKAWQELGTAYLALGRYSEAAAALQRSLATYDSIFGGSNDMGPQVLDYEARLLALYAKALEGAGRSSAAEAVLARLHSDRLRAGLRRSAAAAGRSRSMSAPTPARASPEPPAPSHLPGGTG